MSKQNPSDETRRAIEGLLGRKSKTSEPAGESISPENELSKQVEPENEEDLEYSPVVLKEDETDPDQSGEESFRLESVDFEPKQKNQNGLIIAATILAISLVTSLLIIIREDVANFFLNKGDDTIIAQQHERIAELKAEIKELKESGPQGNPPGLSESNLRTANQNLNALLQAEKLKNETLRSQLDKQQYSDNDQSEQSSGALSERIRQLETELADTKRQLNEKDQQIASLDNSSETNSERLISLTRENSRLNEELEEVKEENRSFQKLRRENDNLENRNQTLSRQLRQANSQVKMLQSRVTNSESGNEQIETVNNEYQRVLNLLKESRDANNDKQAKIDQLMRENTSLQSRVNNLERRYTQPGGNSSARRVSGNNSYGTVDPVLKSLVRPTYPDSASRRGVAGIVMVRILISSEGNVIDAQILSSPDPLKALDRAALEAVRRWKYEPARVNGRAVEVWHRVPLEFTLNRDE